MQFSVGNFQLAVGSGQFAVGKEQLAKSKLACSKISNEKSKHCYFKTVLNWKKSAINKSAI
jgi:hypothetical protein